MEVMCHSNEVSTKNMSSTFETLSDEILMIVFQYMGDMCTILRTFYGLNQHLNDILLKKLPHTIQYLFFELSSSIEINSKLHLYLQFLISNYIKEQYLEIDNQVRSLRRTFQITREKLSEIEMLNIDNELQAEFFNLQTTVPTIQSIKHIQSLVFTSAACIQCDNHEPNQFNFTKALNRFLLCRLNDTNPANDLLIQPLTHMFQALILSNIDVLLDRDYTEIEESSTAWHFLFYSIYQLQYWYYTPPDISINMKCYQAITQLLLFAIQCHKQNRNVNQNWAQESLFNILKMIGENQMIKQNETLIQAVQREILNIIIEENVLTSILSWQDEQNNTFQSIFSKLIQQNQVDIILQLYRELPTVRSYFNQSKHLIRNVNILTGSSTGRQIFKLFFDEEPLQPWLVNRELFFLLLSKKERQFLEKILKLSPDLIHTKDENGNNPLVYICLKVRGCRERIIEYLIRIGCDTQQRNHNGENFFDAIQMKSNQNLLKDVLQNNQNQLLEINSSLVPLLLATKV
ncbi:hypothetical protein I4U23_019847 [Adineta vaga]|nr:hypothetical protein I4U23_019847 [Adineta vaga]